MAYRYHAGVWRSPLFLLLLWCAPAWAGPSEDAAVQASATLDEHCADLKGGEVTLRAGFLKEVATSWEAVSQAYDVQPELYLLYWRGALAQCLGGFDDDARNDLESFWRLSEGDAALADQRRDAQRRLRSLGVQVSDDRGAPPGPGIGVGIGLLSGGGVMTGLAVWQLTVLRDAEDRFVLGTLPRAEVDAAQQEGERAASATNAFASAGIGFGIGAIPLILIDALQPPKAREPQRAPTVVTPVPTLLGVPDGVVPGVVGRW